MKGKLLILTGAFAIAGCGNENLETMTYTSQENGVQEYEVAQVKDKYGVNIPVKVANLKVFPECSGIYTGRMALSTQDRKDFGKRLKLTWLENGEYKSAVLSDYDCDGKVNEANGDIPKGTFLEDLDEGFSSTVQSFEEHFGKEF